MHGRAVAGFCAQKRSQAGYLGKGGSEARGVTGFLAGLEMPKLISRNLNPLRSEATIPMISIVADCGGACHNST